MKEVVIALQGSNDGNPVRGKHHDQTRSTVCLSVPKLRYPSYSQRYLKGYMYYSTSSSRLYALSGTTFVPYIQYLHLLYVDYTFVKAGYVRSISKLVCLWYDEATTVGKS